MDKVTKKYLEDKHGVVIVAHPGDKDLFTVVYALDVPADNPKDACASAMKIMRDQLAYVKKFTMGGPVLETIDPQGKRFVVDYNEVDESGLDGSVTEQ